MSKKKVSGGTMTLKDFHGGSIPSDLPVPSAPSHSQSMRTCSDGSGYERPSSWGRSDNRSRPHTSPATRPYDDKTPFLTHTSQIGNNFDEDERKPLHGVSAPRTTITDHTLWAPPSRLQLQLQLQRTSSYSPSFTPHNSGSNAWAITKEPACSASLAVSRLANATAIDKVSSGIWHSKALHYQAHAQLVASSQLESGPRANNPYDAMDTVGEKEHYDAVLARHAESGLSIDDQMQGTERNELMDSKCLDLRPTNIAFQADGLQLPQSYGKLGWSELQHPMPSEPTDRPKLKLLPRTKALESAGPSVPYYGYRQVNDSGHVEIVNKVHGHANFVKPVSAGTESGKEVGHCPKLNLKPRSWPLEQLEGNTALTERGLLLNTVLKERGIDDVAINSFDLVEHSNRIEHSIVRGEKRPDHSTQIHYGEKTEDAPLDRRTGKKLERKEQGIDAERVNVQSRNWRGDNQRNIQETDRQQVSERQPSPEKWRKPAQLPRSCPDAVSMHHGRAASAVELAQAFSRSVSDPKVNDKFTCQRGLNTGRTQIPFSRLVGPTSTPRINGY